MHEPAPPLSRITRDNTRDHFTRQRASAADLPDPEHLMRSLAQGVLEVLAGVRDVDQMARWLTQEPYRKLVVRSNLAARARSARESPVVRPAFQILAVRSMSPRDGVAEGVVVVAGPHRTRAIALRLEGIDGRWRATALALL